MYQSQDSKDLMQTIIDFVTEYLSDYEGRQNNLGLYLWSECKGSGKTKTAAAIANELIKTHQVKFATSLSILNEIRATYDKSNDLSESKLIDELIMTEILIIDDFGVEEVKSWINDKIYTIVNERYINRKVTIYTSNLPADKLKYDSRITNRVIETTYQLHFPEESVREVIAKINSFKVQGFMSNKKAIR